jgi:predicted RNase H-like HicB family nuclease
MKGYAILIEKGKSSWGASVPDLPGCYAVSKTRRGVVQLIREGIALHIKGLREDGLPVPDPVTGCKVVEV